MARRACTLRSCSATSTSCSCSSVRRTRAAREADARFSKETTIGPMGEIARRPWGEVSFYVEDPFGNKLCFVDRATVFTG